MDPINGYNFAVRLLDAASMLVTAVGSLFGAHVTADAGFSECRGLEGQLQIEEQPEGGRNDRVLRFPTRMRWSNITLQRGVGLSPDLWAWYASYASGQGTRRDGLIVLMNDAREPVMFWKFTRGLPVRWTGPTLNARAGELAIESLEIAHEGLTVQPGPGLFSPV
jgi:phage tail-like protein